MRRIVQNGHCLHLVIEDASPEAVALVEAILAADQAVRKNPLTSSDIAAVYDAITKAERAWCQVHGLKSDIQSVALLALLGDLNRSEARHATA